MSKAAAAACWHRWGWVTAPWSCRINEVTHFRRCPCVIPAAPHRMDCPQLSTGACFRLRSHKGM